MLVKRLQAARNLLFLLRL